MISDNIPIFNEYQAPDKENEGYTQLRQIFWLISEYNAVLTLNQAFLLKEYETNLRGTLHTLLEELYNESLSCGLEDCFFTNWVISDDDIRELNMDTDEVERFKQFQKEFILIQRIKTVTHTGNCTGGCDNEII